jgi:SAM-dependent methyltransferase
MRASDTSKGTAVVDAAFTPQQSLEAHPDRVSWNGRHARSQPDLEAHPLAHAALELGIPDGPVLELACGVSGNALALAEAGHQVTAVDISDLALQQLNEAARRLGLAAAIHPVHADLASLELAQEAYVLVLCTYYWETEVFRQAHHAIAPGGILAWETVTSIDDDPQPRRERWLPHPDEPARLLPGRFQVIENTQRTGQFGEDIRCRGRRHSTVRLLARKARQPPPHRSTP